MIRKDILQPVVIRCLSDCGAGRAISQTIVLASKGTATATMHSKNRKIIQS